MNCDHCIGLDNDDRRQVYLSNASLHHPDTYDLFKFCPDCGASLASLKIPEYKPVEYDDSNDSEVTKAFRSESKRFSKEILERIANSTPFCRLTAEEKFNVERKE